MTCWAGAGNRIDFAEVKAKQAIRAFCQHPTPQVNKNMEIKVIDKDYEKAFEDGEKSFASAVLRRINNNFIQDKLGHIELMCRATNDTLTPPKKTGDKIKNMKKDEFWQIDKIIEENQMKKEIIKDWNKFVIKELCPAKCGHLRFKIRDFWLQKLEAEKQKWAEDLIKKIPKKRNVEICSGGYKTFYKRKDLACMFEFGKNEGYNQALKELKTIIENAK